jgi:hypothetical protein
MLCINSSVRQVDPEVLIIKNAFEDYCSTSVLVGWGGDVMSVNDLQEVFIRLFNRFVSQEDIDVAIAHTDEIEPGLEELTLNEFRAVHRRYKRLCILLLSAIEIFLFCADLLN